MACYHFWGVRRGLSHFLFALPPSVTRGQLKRRMNTTPERTRITLELSSTVAALLDHVSDVTGANKTQLVQAALVAALPDLVARADAFKKRHQELSQGKRK